jgi:hypothetical protein
MDNPAIVNTQLAHAHIRTGLAALKTEQGQRLSTNARTLLAGIIRQAQEALDADARNAA